MFTRVAQPFLTASTIWWALRYESLVETRADSVWSIFKTCGQGWAYIWFRQCHETEFKSTSFGGVPTIPELMTRNWTKPTFLQDEASKWTDFCTRMQDSVSTCVGGVETGCWNFTFTLQVCNTLHFSFLIYQGLQLQDTRLLDLACRWYHLHSHGQTYETFDLIEGSQKTPVQYDSFTWIGTSLNFNMLKSKKTLRLSLPKASRDNKSQLM